MAKQVTNVVIAGLGGQGVVKASDIVADAAFRAGHDVKKSELHGMSQRGGSVSSDVRYGEKVLSPMVPPGEADYLVVAAPDQVEPNRWQLRSGGTLIATDMIPTRELANPKSLNVALIGALSTCLDIAKDHWVEAIRANLAPKLYDANIQAFELGRSVMESKKS